MSQLRRSRPTKLQRVGSAAKAGGGRLFPLQKPSGSSSLEEWFKKLAGGCPLEDLSRSVPLGPAIVRAAGKVIEMLASRKVPTQRAAWYIRIAVLNECIKQIRPDRPPPSPRVFWTKQLCTLIKADVDAIRARKTAILGSMDRVDFWRYVLDLVRWQADEGLLEINMWLLRIVNILKPELITNSNMNAPATKISLMAARRFLPEFVASIEMAMALVDALLPAATAVVKAWRVSIAKPQKGKKPAKRFISNSCHAEMTMLLAAALKAIQPDISIAAEIRLSDLERLAKRANDIVTNADRKKKSDTRFPDVKSAHVALRELERLPTHGDVPCVASLLESESDLRVAVKKVCEWAVEGAVVDRAEAICVGVAVISHLGDGLRYAPNGKKRVKKGVHQSKVSQTFTPPLWREIWSFIKDFSEGRDVDTLDKDASLVRFVSSLCRVEQLSLPVLVRDVSRLVTFSHPGAAFLVKCLSLLPDPLDKSIADCRRALLRRYGYVTGTRSKDARGAEEKALEAALSGDMSAMRLQANALLEGGKTNMILSTAEAVRLEEVSKWDESNLQKKLVTAAAFMLHLKEPGMTVEWVIDNFSDVVEGSKGWAKETVVAKRNTVLLVMVRLVENLSRYIAAGGYLETVLNLMKHSWLSSWVSPLVSRNIIGVQAALSRLFNTRSGNRSMYWPRIVNKSLRQQSEGLKLSQIALFAIASMRGKEQTVSKDQSLTEILNFNKDENQGLTHEDDLQELKSRSEVHKLQISTLRTAFSNTDAEFQLENYFAAGLTANILFGSVLIPVLTSALSESSDEISGESSFSKLAVSALGFIGNQQRDIRMQGVRPGIVLDFVALMIAGCICGHTDTTVSLEVLVEMEWVWEILAPGAGILLASRLRKRVDFYCDKAGCRDKEALSALLFNMVTRYSGEQGRLEGAVLNALRTEPFGMVEMQLSLLGSHRSEGGEDLQFASNISDVAITLICAESSRTLMSTVLKCCPSDDSKQMVGSMLGYNAAQGMAISLGYVVTGLTVETAKNTPEHRERAEDWYEVDAARRAILECAVGHLDQEATTQVESMLFEQLVSATEQLCSAQASGCMLSSMLEDGRRISDCLESRLRCLLSSQRTPQAEAIWRQRTLEVANLLKASVPLLKHSAIIAACNVLNMCLKGLSEGGRDDGTGSALNQVLDRAVNRGLKKELETILTPVLLWIEPAERDVLVKLVPRCLSKGTNVLPVRAYKADGSDVDNWVLLEGYGRGGDEEAAVPPEAFARQAEGAVHGERPVAAVHLKRTYSTFASLAG